VSRLRQGMDAVGRTGVAAAYRERNGIERLIGRLKQYRRIATRYETRAANHLAMVTLGMTRLSLT
jgi:transposase